MLRGWCTVHGEASPPREHEEPAREALTSVWLPEEQRLSHPVEKRRRRRG